MRWFAILTLAAALAWLLYTKVWLHPAASGSGTPVDLAAEPVQELLPQPREVFVERGGARYRLVQHHRFELSGQLLSAEHYPFMFSNEFFLVDFGLIWGPRAQELQERYEFRQDHRWLFWQSSGPVSEEERRYITAHISNAHLLPAEGNRNLDRAIRWASRGDLVRVRGYLIDIFDPGGGLLVRSSISRTDSGDGACEVVWVEELQIGNRVYR